MASRAYGLTGGGRGLSEPMVLASAISATPPVMAATVPQLVVPATTSTGTAGAVVTGAGLAGAAAATTGPHCGAG